MDDSAITSFSILSPLIIGGAYVLAADVRILTPIPSLTRYFSLIKCARKLKSILLSPPLSFLKYSKHTYLSYKTIHVMELHFKNGNKQFHASPSVCFVLSLLAH